MDKEQLEKAVRQRLVHCESAQEKEDSEEIKWLNHIKQTLLLIKNQEKIEKEDAYLESAFVQPYKKEYQVAYLHVDNIHLFYEEKYEEHENWKNSYMIKCETVFHLISNLEVSF